MLRNARQSSTYPEPQRSSSRVTSHRVKGLSCTCHWPRLNRACMQQQHQTRAFWRIPFKLTVPGPTAIPSMATETSSSFWSAPAFATCMSRMLSLLGEQRRLDINGTALGHSRTSCFPHPLKQLDCSSAHAKRAVNQLRVLDS